MPVLAGVDAASTYCYLLADAEHRMRIRGRYICSTPMRKDLIPTTRSPMRGKDCGPVRKRLWPTPMPVGDVFHIQKQCESLANVLAQVAMARTSRRKALDVRWMPPHYCPVKRTG